MSAELDSRPDLVNACGGEQGHHAFYTDVDGEKVLVNIKQENEQEWLGPVIIPLIPHFGNKVLISISSNRTQSEASSFADWKLVVGKNILSPKEVSQGVEDRFSFKTLTTLVFESEDIQKVESMELQIGNKIDREPIKLASTKRWYYMPIFGGMGLKPPGRCGEIGTPKLVLSSPSKGQSIIYFYRPKDGVGTARNPDVLLNGKILFEAKYNRYRKIELPGGDYKLEVKGIDLGNPAVEFTLEPNQVYFLRYSPKGESDMALTALPKTVSKPDPQLFFVSTEVGVIELEKTRASD